MKIGRDPDQDVHRVAEARKAIGEKAELFVDANGAYDRKQALMKAEQFAEYGVCWFEEPVSSDDLAGLRLLRDRAPAGMDITSGEYGYDLFYFKQMMDAGAVDVLQPDGTRCGGVTKFHGGGGTLPGPAVAALGPYGPFAASAFVLRSDPRPAHRILPRSRPHRTDVLRRRSQAGRRQAASRSIKARSGAGT